MTKTDVVSSNQTKIKRKKKKKKNSKTTEDCKKSVFIRFSAELKADLKTSVTSALAASGVTELELWNHGAQNIV